MNYLQFGKPFAVQGACFIILFVSFCTEGVLKYGQRNAIGDRMSIWETSMQKHTKLDDCHYNGSAPGSSAKADESYVSVNSNAVAIQTTRLPHGFRPRVAKLDFTDLFDGSLHEARRQIEQGIRLH